MIICWLVSYGNGSTKETDKIVDHIDGVIENNDYTIIYFGAHWCGPCISGFKNKMIDIINKIYEYSRNTKKEDDTNEVFVSDCYRRC